MNMETNKKLRGTEDTIFTKMDKLHYKGFILLIQIQMLYFLQSFPFDVYNHTRKYQHTLH